MVVAKGSKVDDHVEPRARKANHLLYYDYDNFDLQLEMAFFFKLALSRGIQIPLQTCADGKVLE